MRIYNFLLLLIIPVIPVNGQLRLKIESAGNLTAEEVITEVLQEKEFDDTLGIENHLRKVTALLHDRAWLEASIDSIVYRPGGATAWLHTGRQYNRVEVCFEGIDRQVLRTLNIRPDRYRDRTIGISTFRDLQNRVLTHYENSGYPFTSVALGDIVTDDNVIRGRLKIEKNRYYRIDSIHIYGDARVESKYLFRHLGIHPGDPYSEERFRTTGQLIDETPFLTQIREAEMEFMSETADLYLYLGSRQASSFSGIIGILPGRAGNSTGFTGEINLDLINAFRKMESINLQWQSPASQVQQVDVEFGQSYLFGRSFGADIQLHMFRQDSTYMTVEAEGGVPFTIPGKGVVRVYGRTLNTSLIGGGQVSEPDFPSAKVRGQIFGLSYRHNRIDNRINPYRGWLISTSLGGGNKKVSPPAESTYEERRSGFGEATARLEWFIPVTRRSTVLLSGLSGIKINTGGERRDNHFFANELFRLGGLHSVRGFDERSLAASAYAIQRLEYRYLFDASGNVFLFFDWMAYRQKLPGSVISDTPFGFGGGLAVGTRAGQLSVIYALGREHNNPLSFRSSRIHVGIINRF
ncbi:MAG: BamA/TamA family outer membrane protein [Bacteroidales bacterium]